MYSIETLAPLIRMISVVEIIPFFLTEKMFRVLSENRELSGNIWRYLQQLFPDANE